MADVHCLDGLNKFSERKDQAGNGIPYKYVFNLCGQDFPIKTNFELVRALKELNGRDECESFDLEGAGKIGRVQKGYSLGAGGGGYNELREDTACFYKYVRFKGHKYFRLFEVVLGQFCHLFLKTHPVKTSIDRV